MIVVTGATGFLGRFVLHSLLEHGHNVCAYVRRADHPALSPFAGRIKVVEGDIFDTEGLVEAFTGATAVVHTAAVIGHHKADYPVMKRTNQDGTANVVNMALECGVGKLVHVSSVAALGRTPDGKPVNEDTPYKRGQGTYYGYTKYLAEKEVFRGIEEGLPAVICNPSIILGAGGWQDGSTHLFKRVYRGSRMYPVGINGLVGVKDVARAITLLVQGPERKGERYILTAEHWSYKDLFTQMAADLGVKPPSIRLNPTLAQWAGRLAEWTALNSKPFLTREMARNASNHYQYDNSRFIKAYNFTYQPIREVIAETAAQFLAEHGAHR